MKKETFKALPFRKKVTYVLRKYTCSFILAALLIPSLAIWVWEDVLHEGPDMIVEMIGTENTEAATAGFDTFLAEPCMECQKKAIKVSTLMQFEDEEEKPSCNPRQMLFCSLKSGRTDLYFWDTAQIEDIMVGNGLMDLREILPKEVLDQNTDCLIYTGPVLEGGFPCAIRLNNNQWVQDNDYYENCSVGVAKHAQDTELISSFLTYILG